MAEQLELIQKREEIKHQIATGRYKSAIDNALDGTGYLIQKLTRRSTPPSFWYSAITIAVINLLAGFLIFFSVGELELFRRENLNLAMFGISTVGLLFAFMIAYKIGSSIVFTALRKSVLDAIESGSDLTDFQHHLTVKFNPKRDALFGLIYGIFWFVYAPILVAMTAGVISFGSAIFGFITQFQLGLVLYPFLLTITLPVQLSGYKLRLYAIDPSSSEVIDRLSAMLSKLLYIGAILAALSTLLFTFYGLLLSSNVILLILMAWVPLTVAFVVNQTSLARIITRAKWNTLNEVQNKIEKLYIDEDVANEETMETVKRLIDFHNQVRNTPNSVLNLRAGLNFLNSLLLPLLAFVLANLDKVIELF